MFKRLGFVLLAMVFMGSVVADAKMNIKEKKKFKQWEKFLVSSDSWIPTMNKSCGTKITFHVKEVMVKPYMKANRSGTYFCDGIASTMNSMCKSDSDNIVKPEIAKIKKVVCTTDVSKPKGKAYKLEKGVLTATVGVEASNTDRAFKEWIENNL